MPSRGIAARRVGGQRTAGGIGVPARHGERRRAAASAAVNRVAGIASGFANGARRNKPLPKMPPRRSARVSAQPRFWRNLLVPVRAAMSCSLLRDVVLISDSVRACAVRLYGESSSGRCGGDGGANAIHGVVAEFRLGGRKYVVAHCRPLACGPIVVSSLLRFAATILQTERFQDTDSRERTMKDWPDGEIRWIALGPTTRQTPRMFCCTPESGFWGAVPWRDDPFLSCAIGGCPT